MGSLEVDTDVSIPNLVLSHAKAHDFGRFGPRNTFHSLHWQQDPGVWVRLLDLLLQTDLGIAR